MGLLSLSAECCVWKCQHAICAHSHAHARTRTLTQTGTPPTSAHSSGWAIDYVKVAPQSLRSKYTVWDGGKHAQTVTHNVSGNCGGKSIFLIFFFFAKRLELVLFLNVNLNCCQSQNEYCWQPFSQTCRLTKRNGSHLQESQEMQLWLRPPHHC